MRLTLHGDRVITTANITLARSLVTALKDRTTMMMMMISIALAAAAPAVAEGRKEAGAVKATVAMTTMR